MTNPNRTNPASHGPDGRFLPTGRPPADDSQEPNQVARRARRQAAKAAKPKPETPARDERGTFRSVNPGGGRKKGSPDTVARVFTVKAVLQDLFQYKNLHAKMMTAIDTGIQSKDRRTALGFVEMASRVLDKTDDTAGRVVHFHLHTNVDIYALGKAREMHGLPPIARRVDPE